MKLSARNVFKGKIKKMTPGAVNAEVVIELPGGLEIVAMVTRGSVDRLALAEGKEAYAVVKASSVILAVD